MRVVSPFRPFVPESAGHVALGAFDWRAALGLLASSVQRACGCPTVALTDPDTDVPVPAYRFPTAEPRLMLWILEVSLAYLRSPMFDTDTVFVSPDVLVVGDLRPYFAGDLTLLVRTREKYRDRPIMNGMQWWPVAGRDRLIEFYAAAMAVARTLPADVVTWGADSEALRVLVDPIRVGVHRRSRCAVSMLESDAVLVPLHSRDMAAIDAGEPMARPSGPAIDFKYATRKPYMARVWHRVTACG